MVIAYSFLLQDIILKSFSKILIRFAITGLQHQYITVFDSITHTISSIVGGIQLLTTATAIMGYAFAL